MPAAWAVSFINCRKPADAHGGLVVRS